MRQDETRKKEARARIEKRRRQAAGRATKTLPLCPEPTPGRAGKNRRWVRHHEEANQCLQALGEKIGLPTAPVPLPAGLFASINDRIEDRLEELGVPARLQVSVVQLLSRQHVTPLVNLRLRELYEDTGDGPALDPDEVDPIHLEMSLNLYALCRIIGVELTLDEAWQAAFEIWEWTNLNPSSVQDEQSSAPDDREAA